MEGYTVVDTETPTYVPVAQLSHQQLQQQQDAYNNQQQQQQPQENVAFAAGASGTASAATGAFGLAALHFLLFLVFAIWALIVLYACVKDPLMDVHGAVGACVSGSSCQDPTLVNGTGTCVEGVCTGDPCGQCAAIVQPNPNDCPDLTWSWPVMQYNYWNMKLCWYGKCSWFLAAGASHDWACSGADSGRYELKKHAARHCLSYINEDPLVGGIDVTLTCISNNPICEFFKRGATYTAIEGTVVPYTVDGDVQTLEDADDELAGRTKLEYVEDAYEAWKDAAAA